MTLVVLAMFAAPPKIEIPVCKDPTFEIALFAAEPDIVTPTGLAVAADGAILVAENHTHFPLKDYPGPKFDRILRFVDKDDDGKPDSRNVFADGLKDTMGISAHPDGTIWVACRHAIFRFTDADGDGVAEKKEKLIRLETKGDYPHNGLSGFAIEPTKYGDVYFGIGENFGESFKIIGPSNDFSSIGGEGGSVFRCRSDGSNIERFAFGFWNPYHGCLDGYGRLFICDNDPDDRPPCRLLHLVDGGDYGYRFRNGRRGIHPFTAWNGELPGTLPMVAATGEAPSGLVHIASDAFGAKSFDSLIGTSWGDHRLERFKLEPRGASFHSQPEPLVTGGENFRPVGIVTDVRGNMWVSDWVDKSYNVHRKGRIWRVRAKKRPKTPVVERRPYQRTLDLIRNPATPNAAFERGNRADDASDPSRYAALLRLLRGHTSFPGPSVMETMPREAVAEVLRIVSPQQVGVAAMVFRKSVDDRFLQQAALYGIARAIRPDELKSMIDSGDPAFRLAGVLAHRMREPTKNPDWLVPRFDDDDPVVQFAAVQTVGEHRIKSLRPHVVKLLESGKATGKLFLACTAALDDLDRVKKNHSDEFNAGEVLINFVLKPDAKPSLIREALPFIPPNHPRLKIDFLNRLLESEDEGLRHAVILTIRERPLKESQPSLLGVMLAKDPTPLRLEAVVGLSAEDPDSRKYLLSLALDSDDSLRREALRSLRNAKLSADDFDRIQAASANDPASQEMVSAMQGRKSTRPKPTDQAGWLKLLEGRGDADAGRRLFFHPQGPGCYKCHRINERGGLGGPDLSAVGGSMTRERILESILQPSKEVAPMFTSWTLVMNDGTTKVGLFVGGSNQNTQIYFNPDGRQFEVKPEDVESRKPNPNSIMPAELVDRMTHQELRDLLAFLQTKKR